MNVYNIKTCCSKMAGYKADFFETKNAIQYNVRVALRYEGMAKARSAKTNIIKYKKRLVMIEQGITDHNCKNKD